MNKRKWHYFTFTAPDEQFIELAAVEASTPLLAQRRLASLLPWAENILYTTDGAGLYGPAVISIGANLAIPDANQAGG